MLVTFPATREFNSVEKMFIKFSKMGYASRNLISYIRIVSERYLLLNSNVEGMSESGNCFCILCKYLMPPVILNLFLKSTDILQYFTRVSIVKGTVCLNIVIIDRNNINHMT